MRLRLKNFRCYLDKEFDFGAEGLLLLSGSSGAGKTSIILAINFVLYGTGTKITTFGKTSCSVEIEFDDIKITRTKRPNRLVLTDLATNEELEDDAAQGVINEKFGTAFEITSYVPQNATNSFIMLSPLEKLAFLEKFAFHSIDLTKIKSRCQAVIKQRNEALIASTSQLEMANEHFKTLVKPQKIAFPIKTKDKEKAIKNETIKLKNTKILIKRAEKILENFRQEHNALKILDVQLTTRNSSLKKLEEKLDTITGELKMTQYQGDDKLREYEDILQAILAQRELLILQEKYKQDEARLETMQEMEDTETKKKIETIKNNLWKEYTKEEIDTTISEYKQIAKDSEQLYRLETSLDKYKVNEEKFEENKASLESSRIKLTEKKEKLAKLLLQQELYECPSCHVSLRFHENELQLSKEEIENDGVELDTLTKEIAIISKTVNKLEYLIPEEQSKLKHYKDTLEEINSVKSHYEDPLPSKDEVEADIEHLKDYKRSQLELEKKKTLLETNLSEKIYSSSLTTFREQLSKQKDDIKTMQSKVKGRKVNFDIDEEELRQMIQIERQNRDKIEQYNKQTKNLTKEIEILKAECQQFESEHISLFQEIHDIVDIEVDIQTKEGELAELKQNLEKYETTVVKIDEYKKYTEELARYTEWKTKVEELTEQEQKNRQHYAAATLLKDKILEAESIAILNVISSINIHAQEYLDIFFPVDPIVVRLTPFKTTKKKTSKPQVNLEIDYKGMEADIGMLSGGELSRVVLAYTLALAEIFNSPLILLDECTASLDQEMTSIVMEGIRKNFPHKLIVAIAHQVISGDFDRQISL